MKKVFLMIIGLILLAGCQGASAGLLQDQPSEMEFEPVRRGTLEITVGADGVVSAYQTGLLIWGTTGTVGQVQVQVGDRVQKDQPLASLEQSSLPQAVILAQVEVTAAQKTLEDLRLSQVQRAQALQAVEAAEQALEDARNPASIQAEAQARVANAQKTLDEAQRLLDILTTPPSQAAIEQAYANLVMAENVLNSTRRDIERIEKRINKPPEAYLPWENRQIYRNILQGLELKLASVQRSYEEAEQKYNRLLESANPNDIAQAEAGLARAQAELGQAERDLERVKDGTSPADLAVLQARLDDARREWERLKNGPPPEEVAAAQARLAAAQATLKLTRLEAPFAGIVTMVAVNPGDQVAPGTQAFRLDDLSRLLVETQVSEIDINRIQPGQSVVVTFDSILAKEYQGEVVEVSPVANIVQGLASFTVKVELIDANELVKPGMTASATFVVSELEDVLLVPMRALRVLENQRVVYTWRNNQEIPVTVRLGATSGSYAQVLEGDLRPGDQIVLTPGGGSQAEQ
ncbi:MAG TPA: efflux RND transporter periplasmic adaptor subunit [Anaerolineales bacterium]|nr:efflux RND transporter periplasmic adaptor subunit [Anaerolineales bacterium]